MYSLLCEKNSQRKVKGIKNMLHVRHESFLEVIRNSELTTDAIFRLF